MRRNSLEAALDEALGWSFHQRGTSPRERLNTRFIDRLKIDEAEGTVYWKHRRMLLFDAAATGSMRKELIETGSKQSKKNPHPIPLTPLVTGMPLLDVEAEWRIPMKLNSTGFTLNLPIVRLVGP